MTVICPPRSLHTGYVDLPLLMGHHQNRNIHHPVLFGALQQIHIGEKIMVPGIVDRQKIVYIA
jgi:predicted ribosome-associated RNA-binding protein Tma20